MSMINEDNIIQMLVAVATAYLTFKATQNQTFVKNREVERATADTAAEKWRELYEEKKQSEKEMGLKLDETRRELNELKLKFDKFQIDIDEMKEKYERELEVANQTIEVLKEERDFYKLKSETLVEKLEELGGVTE